MVRARAGLTSIRLFRRNVLGSSASLIGANCSADFNCVQYAQVRQACASIFSQQDVAWFYVSVYESQSMDGIQSGSNICNDTGSLSESQPSIFLDGAVHIAA